MIVSIPYILLIVFLGILALILHQRSADEKYCHRIKLMGVGTFFLFFAFRGFIFHDWNSYYPEFEKCSWDLLFNYELGKSREPGFLIFELLCKTVFDSYHFLVFMSALINTVLLVNFFRRYSTNILLGLVFYLAFDGFEISSNLIRNSTAIFLFLNAIPYLYERRPIPYFLMCLLAVSFHFSAFVYFPLYFFFHRKLNKWVYLGIFAACLSVFILHIPIFLKLVSASGIGGEFVETKIEAYMEMRSGRGFGMGFLERVITGSLIFCYFDKLNGMKPENKIFINALVAYFIAAFMFSDFAEIGKRLYMLFIFSYWIIWGDLIRCFAIGSNKRLFIAFVGIYCILKTVTTINQPCQEYDNLLFGKIKSYQERKYTFERTFEEPE